MRHILFLRNLAQLQFTGKLTRLDEVGHQWIFYLFQGRIVWVTGGIHPVRRWSRVLATHGLQTLLDRAKWHADLSYSSSTSPLGWEYKLLQQWVDRRDITLTQAIKIIQTIAVEALFELTQAGRITDQIQQQELDLSPLSLIRLEEITSKAQLRWQAWENAQLTAYSPNCAPVIRQADRLRHYTSESLYHTLSRLLDGQQTLFDLAEQMQRDVTEVATSLLPFMRMGLIELIDISDLPAPISPWSMSENSLPLTVPKQALVACVDDSFLVRHMMEKLLISAGYEFVGIEDAIRAIGILLSCKPDFIFLDLMMPNTNGNELCTQLRKLKQFRDTPIVILTGSDGYANRLRSSFAGATEFLTKPLNAEAVLSVIRKYLKQPSPSNVSVP